MNVWRKSVCIQIRRMLLMGGCLFFQMQALDVPVFYRAPLFQGQPASSNENWAIFLKAHYAQASTRKAWDLHSNHVSLFSTHGFFDVGKLGLNLENLASKPVTNDFWGTGGHFQNGPEVPVEFTGKFRVQEFDLTWRQNIMAGFFAQVYFPIKWLRLDQINFINRGKDSVNGVNIEDFLNNNLDPILEENGLMPIKTVFKKSGVSDLVVSAGWQSQTCTDVGFIDSIVGQLQLGVLIPLAGKRDINRVFSLSRGHDQFLGALGRANLEVALWKYLHLGVNAGALIFFYEERMERVTTSKNQQGWIVLEKAKVKKDQGSIWDVQLYVQGYRLIGGLSALVGFSYTTQERTDLSVRDDNYLKTFIDDQKSGGATANTPPFPVIVSQNDIANANKLLAQWEQYTIHFLVEYDVRAHTDSSFAPKLSFAYDWSMYGRRAFQADMIGGSVEFQIQFNF